MNSINVGVDNEFYATPKTLWYFAEVRNEDNVVIASIRDTSHSKLMPWIKSHMSEVPRAPKLGKVADLNLHEQVATHDAASPVDEAMAQLERIRRLVD